MSLERGRITVLQLFFMVVGYVLGSSLLLVPGSEAKRDSWLAIAVGIIEGVAIAMAYLSLASRFSGKTPIQIVEMVYGRLLGKIIIIAYIWFFLHLCSLVLGNYVDFLTATVMLETPSIVLGILLLGVCGSAARNGPEVIARSCQIVVPTMLAFTSLSLVLSIREMDLRNILPVMDIPLSQFLWAAHEAATFPFAETVTFIAILPFVRERGTTPSVIKAIVIAGAVLVLLSLRNTAILGSMEFMYVYPSFEAIRLVNIAETLTRLELLSVFSFVFMGFVKIAIILYSATSTLAELLHLDSYLHIVYPFAALVLALQTINFTNVAQNFEFATIVWPVYAVPFELGIPLVTLVIAALRGLPRKETKNDVRV